jgi:hypothetical protein
MPCHQSNRYCFTINQNKPIDTIVLERFHAEHCKYLIHLQEDNQIQGFFTLKKKTSITGVTKALLHNRHHHVEMHLSAAKAPSLQIANSYRRDSGNWVEFGSPPYPGKRSDLDLNPRDFATVNEYMAALNKRQRLQPPV